MESQAQQTPARTADAMAAVIEQQIVPRLLLLNRITLSPISAVPAKAGFAIDAFAQFVIEADAEAIDQRIGALCAEDGDAARVFLDCLSPVARALGRLWEEDRVSFTDVTLALGKLNHALHRAAARARAGRTIRPTLHTAYFAAVPGEQHTFGLTMLDEIFRFAGWDTVRDIEVSAGEIVRAVGDQHFDLIGLSCGNREHCGALKTLIERVRSSSRNRGILIMVGGPAFLDDADRAMAVGADCTAADAREALAIVEKKMAAGACAEKLGGSI